MRKDKTVTPAPGEIFIWSLLAQYERQLFGHEFSAYQPDEDEVPEDDGQNHRP